VNRQETSFRHSFVRPLLCSLVAGLPLAVIAIGLSFGFPLDLVGLAMGLAGGALAGGLVTLLWTKTMKVHVTPDGLRCYDVWSVYRFVPWNTMESIRPINFIGLPYLRVSARQLSRPIWVPLFLADRPAFVTSVSHYAGSENILVQALKANGA
jgi:hypothetical protein